MSSLSDYYRRRSAPPEPGQPALELPAPEQTALPASATSYAGEVFAISLPEGWRDCTLYVFAGPLDDGPQQVVTVATDLQPGAAGLEAYADQQVAALKTEVELFEVVRCDQVVLQSGLKAAYATLSWSPVEGHSVIQEQLYVLHEGTGYKLTTTYPPGTFETRGPAVRALLLSFRPTGPRIISPKESPKG